MIKRVLLLFIWGFTLYNCKAQQVFECRSLGFKFVMDCECQEYYVTDPQLRKIKNSYSMNVVPQITYIEKGSPSFEKVWPSQKIFMVNDELTYDKTGEEILALLKKTNGGAVKLLIGLSQVGGSNDEIFITPGNDVVFPESKYAPVEGGPKLLGTIRGKAYNAPGLSVTYENGDGWVGKVVNKMYPDYSDTQGQYTSHQKTMKAHYDFNKAYQDSMVIVKKEAANLERQQQEAAAARAQEQAVMAKEKARKDSIGNSYTLKQMIDFIYPDVSKRPMLFGIGIDVKKEKGTWIVSEVKPASSAWFFGIKEGDVLISVNGGGVNYMSKMDVIVATMGNPWEEKIIEISRPAENITLQKIFGKCYTVYHRPASFTHGCISGNCENGDGVYLDEKSVMYSGGFINGKFNNHLVSKNGGEVVNAAEKIYTYSTFTNGIKNGYTIIYSDRGIISYTGYGSGIFTVGYSGEFKNDVPHGKGVLTRGYANGYNVNYENGVIKGQALKVTDNNHYTYCDVTPRFDLTNCKEYTGTPAEVANAPAPVGSTKNEPADIEESLRFLGDYTKKNGQQGEQFYDEHIEKFTSSFYQKKSVRLNTPALTAIIVYVYMEKVEMDKAKMECHATISEGHVDLNVVQKGGPLGPDGGFWGQTLSYGNYSNSSVEFVVDFDVSAASVYNTRTVYWLYSLIPLK